MLNLFGHDIERTYVVDIESDGLSVTHDVNKRVYLVGVTSLATRQTIQYKSVQEWLDGGYDDGHTYVFHNASFDMAALRLRGAPLTNYFCTMVASHTLNPGSSDEHSLATLMPQTKVTLRELLIQHGYDMKGVKKGEEYTWYGTGKRGVNTIVEEYLDYDLQATCELYDMLLEQYAADELALAALININIPYIECILALQQGTAVRYEPSLAAELQATADHALAESIKICGWTYGKTTVYNTKSGMLKGVGAHCKMEPFNPNSHKQVADELTRLYGWEPKVFTDAGAPSTSTEVLEVLDYPLVEHLLNNSKATKLLSFCNEVKLYDGGFVFSSYNQCATRTTRLSCSKPNIQQIPSRDPLGKNLRKMFVPPDGYTMIVADEDSFQMRIIAAYLSYYFDDNRLVDCINAGEDVHSFFANIYGIARSPGKNVTFGWAFGAGATKMAATANRGNKGEPVTVALIKGALKNLEERMPALPMTKQLYIEHALENGGVIHDWLGQRYTVPEIMSKDKGIRASGERKVFNYAVQGLEATWFRKMQVELQREAYKYDAHLYMAVHDEVALIVPEDRADEAMVELGKVLSPTFASIAPGGFACGGLKLNATFAKGDSWYDCK